MKNNMARLGVLAMVGLGMASLTAKQVKHTPADWCTVIHPDRATMGEALAITVRLHGVNEELKLKVDLHWRDAEGTYRGFYTAGQEVLRAANDTNLSFSYQLRPKAGGTVAAVEPVIVLSPTGEWADRTKHATGPPIPVSAGKSAEQPPGSLTGVPPPKDLHPRAPKTPWEVNPYREWENGPSKSAEYFPIAVWLQDPALAKTYKEAGINLFVGLWKGPTEKHLDQLKAAGMPVICHQNKVGLTSEDNDIIVGWLQMDEPDNAKSVDGVWKNDLDAMNSAWPGVSRQEWGQWGPPMPPSRIQSRYDEIKKKDPTRPVHLNLGVGVAWDKAVGRGIRSGHLEDYPEYIEGCDQVSFDIYPAASSRPAVRERLWMVARGVHRLGKWSKPGQPVWNCLEASKISYPQADITPHKIRAEFWMAIIFGSRGVIYFVHQFKPAFNADSLLDNPDLLAGVTEINRQVHALAPVINSPTVVGGATVDSANEQVPVALMTKRVEDATYVFSVAMNYGHTVGRFTVEGIGDATAEVLGEDRQVAVKDGAFQDAFGGYDVHLYRIVKATKR